MALLVLAAKGLAALLALGLGAVALNVAFQLVRRPLPPLPSPLPSRSHPLTMTTARSPAPQLAPRDPKRPPLVFHYVPVLGCAVSYGMDPLGFLDDCRRRVRAPLSPRSLCRSRAGAPRSRAAYGGSEARADP